MNSHLLVGLDGSAESIAALRWAAWFAAATRRDLCVAHVWEHGRRPSGPLIPDEAPEKANARLREYTERALGDVHVITECHSLDGETAGALVTEARRTDADLLVVGAKGSGRALHALVGSVSRQLIECPVRTVAVVPPGDPPPAGQRLTMLVGVDGSASSSRAVRWAAESAVRSGGYVLALHAFEPPEADLPAVEGASLLAEAGGRLEDEWCGPLRAAGVEFRPIIEPGDPRHVIPRVAEAEQPSCVVLGSRGLGAITQRLLGSVTRHLVVAEQWPVVVVPAPRDCPVWSP